MKLKSALAETFNRQEENIRHEIAKKLWKYRRDNLNLKLYARCLFDILVTEGNISCVGCGIGSDCTVSKRGEKKSQRNLLECVYQKAAYNSFRTHLSNDKEVRRAFMSIPNNIVSTKAIVEHGRKFDF